MAVYCGHRGADGCAVTVDGRPLVLDGTFGVRAGGGFEWGYEGGGPGRLALAILAHHFDDHAQALDHYKTFGQVVIADLRDDDWTLNSSDIDLSLRGATTVPMTLDEVLTKARAGRVVVAHGKRT